MNIYFFTGTGNSLKTAIELQKRIEDSKIIAIKSIDFNKYEVISDKMIIVSPLYFYGLPLIVKDFIQYTSFLKVKSVSCIITSIYPDGIALKQISKLLQNKNMVLDYGIYLKMPPNYVSSYEPLSDKKRDAILKKSIIKLDKIAKDIITETTYIQKESNLFKIIVSAEKVYKKWEKRVNISDNDFLIKNSCNLCGICTQVCSVKNITIKNNKLLFNNKCQQCYACINLCPQKSIGYKVMKKGRYMHPDITIKQLIGN